MRGGLVVVVCVARVSALVARARPRVSSRVHSSVASRDVASMATDASAPPSLYELPQREEDWAFFESLEEALVAASCGESEREWDATFWRELDESALCADARDADGEAAASRLSHFFRTHRVLSLSLDSRTRSEAVSRVSLAPVVESHGGARRVRALNLYSGLTAQAVWPASSFAWLESFRAAVAGEAAVRSELSRASLKAALDAGDADPLEALAPPSEPDVVIVDEGSDEEFGSGFSEDFGELVAEPLAADLSSTELSLAASLDALDALDDEYFGEDEDEDEDNEQRAKRSLAAQLADADDDPAEVAAQRQRDAREAAQSKQQASLSEAQARLARHGRKQTALAAYFRDPQADAFPATLGALRQAGAPFGARHVALQSQRAASRTPFHSELQSYVLTAYVALEDRADRQAGLVVRRDRQGGDFLEDRILLGPKAGDAIVIDSTFTHSTFNEDASDDAHWLVVDFWHPDLSPSEVAALERFLTLDEQYVLRRSPTPEVVAALLCNHRALEFIPLDASEP